MMLTSYSAYPPSRSAAVDKKAVSVGPSNDDPKQKSSSSRGAAVAVNENPMDSSSGLSGADVDA